MDFKAVLAKVVQEFASDLFLKVGIPPAIRKVGKVVSLGGDPLTDQDMEKVFEIITKERHKKIFKEHCEVDLAYELQSVGRFRVNIFKQKGHIGYVFRYLRTVPLTFEALHLPVTQMEKLALMPRGIVLVTGITGSGKSSTLAAMINHINNAAEKHIVTIEDPIEFMYVDQKSIINQRELGEDTMDFAGALKHVLRQAPDVIMVGEIRDEETLETALHAAETGHLVLGTMHTISAVQTVERINNFFPAAKHNFLNQMLSMLLEGVVSQRLIPNRDRTARIPAVEILMGSPTVREVILAGKTRDIYKAIKEGNKYYGTQTFNQSLVGLLNEDLITLEDALQAADSPDELRLDLRGINKDSGGSRFESPTKPAFKR